MLDLIEPLVRAGFAIHWLHKKSKAPIGDDWSSKPVASLKKLQDTYKSGNNVGVRLGKWSKVDDYYLHVIDLDIRLKSEANAARMRLSELFPSWKDYPTVQSGSMGESRHIYILSEKPFPSKKLAHSGKKFVGDDGKEHWTWEIELFGTGKQVAIPPSVHPDTGKTYRWLSEFDFEAVMMGLGPVVSADELQDVIGAEDEEEMADDDERRRPLGLTLDEARNTIWKLPIDDWCHDRDGWLNVGMALHHEFNGAREAFALWCEYAKQSNKFDKSDQARVWKSFKNRGKPLRMASLLSVIRDIELDAEFENLDDDDAFDDEDGTRSDPPASKGKFDKLFDGDDESNDEDEFEEPKEPKKKVSKREEKLNKEVVEFDLGKGPSKKMQRMNKRHAVAFVNGKTVIITEKENGDTAYGSPAELHQWYENDRVPGEKTTEPLSKAWMRSKHRRQYVNGIVFAPGGAGDGYYNHWKGYACEPSDDPSKCRLILAHLKRVICNNDEICYRYALGWFAHLIQMPWDKPGVAMVLRGRKGAGKDTIADYVGGLFPHHHIKIANQEQLTGKFNPHQEKCLMLHVEEGFWAGNKNAEGALKHLITSEKVLIEPKGINPFTVDSVMRLFLSSNEDWVVPATSDERRYFVLDVPSTKIGDRAYFRALRHEMKNGGRAALLHYLQTYDLSEFEVRDVPNTTALSQQKVQGLKNIERWWFMMLESGDLEFPNLSKVRRGKNGDWRRESVVIDQAEFRHSYEQWVRLRRFEGEALDKFELGRRLSKMVPSVATSRPRTDGKQSLAYIVPDLDACREEFEKFLGSQVLWHKDEIRVVADDDDYAELDDDF